MNEIILSAGIGDVIAVERLWTPEERASLKRIHWAHACRSILQPLFEACPEYTHVEHVTHWQDTGEMNGVYTIDQCPQGDDLKVEGAVLWTIQEQFRDVRSRPLVGSSFYANSMADISHLDLPERYLVCQASTPFNSPSHRDQRDYEPGDWKGTRWVAEDCNLPVIVLNSSGADPAPDHPLILDWQGKTTFAESLEICKRAEGYVGIDSTLSVFCSEFMGEDQMKVKCRNPWCLLCKSIYYAPHKRCAFLRDMIRR